MKFRSLLIVTYGRSGSTLLQGILNSIPGCLIRGENYSLCEGLYRSYRAYLRTQQKITDEDTLSPSSPWYGAAQLDAQRYIADLRAMLLSHLTLGVPRGTQLQCVGFKEIRYLKIDMPPDEADYEQYFQDYLDFLTKLLPELAIVFLTREPAQVVNSAWWKEWPRDFVLSNLAGFHSAAAKYARQHDNCCFIDYADVVRNGEALASLFTFLGAPCDHAKVAEVLGRRHSYDLSSSALPTMINLNVRVYNKPAEVRLVRIDPVPPQLALGRKFHFGGVVVLTGNANGTLSLRDGQDHDMPLKWGLPSPVVGNEMQDVAQAQTARFRCNDVQVVPQATYRLMFKDGASGHEHCLASLSLQAMNRAEGAPAQVHGGGAIAG